MFVFQERLVKREPPPAPSEEDAPGFSDDAAAAEVASSQVVAAAQAAGITGDLQPASSAPQDDKSATVSVVRHLTAVLPCLC